MYSIQTGGRKGSRILFNNRAIVLHQGKQSRWAGRMKGWLIRAQEFRSKRIYCKGQASGRAWLGPAHPIITSEKMSWARELRTWVGFYKLFVHSKAFLHKSVILVLPPLSALLTLLPYYCTTNAQHTTPQPTPLMVAITVEYWQCQYRVKAKTWGGWVATSVALVVSGSELPLRGVTCPSRGSVWPIGHCSGAPMALFRGLGRCHSSLYGWPPYVLNRYSRIPVAQLQEYEYRIPPG